MNYLLLGAGFSRNWGGWLAQELHGELLGRTQSIPEIYKALRANANFEDVLFDFQVKVQDRGPERWRSLLSALESAIESAFAEMNLHFAKLRTLDFLADVDRSPRKFLSRFDAVFSLNQDLLLELHYADTLISARAWDAFQYPGISPPAGWQHASPADKIRMHWHPSKEFLIEPRSQPIYKLHGTVTWHESAGDSLVVMGGGKAAAIERSPLLSRYSRIFEEAISTPGAKLMIIGYGFRDEHINKIILAAAERHPLPIYLVDTRGLGVFDRPPGELVTPKDLFAGVRFVGISARTLRETFTTDSLQQRSLERFIERPGP